jgi:fructokinase
MSMIVVCGEALMDVFSAGDTATGTALDARVGGSPFNVALGLARLAQPVAFFGAVSHDFLGQRLLRALNEEGVDTRAVAQVQAPSTLSLVGMDAHGVPSYAFYGQGAADRQLTLADLARVPEAAQAIHLGSFATVVAPVADTLRALVHQRGGRAVVSFDPNIRLNVVPEVAPWLDMLAWMLPRTHLLKISDEDLGLLYPGTTPQQFCERALAQGVRLVIVTLGSEGVVAQTPRARVSVPATPVQVVDTVGAGDTFQAALLTWLAEQGRLIPQALGELDAAPLRAALSFAAQAAAITCSRRGADLPRRAELPQ